MMENQGPRSNLRRGAVFGILLTLPFLLGSGHATGVRFSVTFQGDVPGLRFRSDPGSLFVRSATAFENELGLNTASQLAATVNYLRTRYGFQSSCPPVPMVDVFRSNFLTGDIRMVDGAWAFYTDADVAGGPCPYTNLEPRQPSFYFETITQSGTYNVDMTIGNLRVPWQPQVKIVQVLVIPNKQGLVTGGTYGAAHGPYELLPLNAADLTESWDNFLYGEMQLDWGVFQERVHVESFEPDTMTPSGASRQTLLMQSQTMGTGVYEVVYHANAISWAEDPEITGNPVLGIPRNPILTPKTIHFRYSGQAVFPFDPATDVPATCTNDFSDPNHLRICPPSAPQN